MKLYLLIFSVLILFLMESSCTFRSGNAGLHDDFSSLEGWREVDPNGDTILPVITLEIVNGKMIIPHKFRTLEFAAEKFPWIESTIDTCTNLRKNYGLVDLDKFHYVVLNVGSKGSSSYFDINGYTTKLGYTTGITVIDLLDYDDERIKGIKAVDFGIELQDNHTSIVLDELKFVSKLSKEEEAKLIGVGWTIRDENFNPKPYHGLEALKSREQIVLPELNGEEMAIFRDDATGAITMRLTAAPGDDHFGEGGIWSADGAAIKFESKRDLNGAPVCIPGKGIVVSGPVDAISTIWSPDKPDILYALKRKGLDFTVSAWDKVTGAEYPIANFSVPEIGSYIEFKRFTPMGNIVVVFRETPHLFIIDVVKQEAKYYKMPTRLKDASVIENEKIVTWANCYTYEIWWKNLETGETGSAPSFSAGHASHGINGMVANFGGHLNVFVPGDIGLTFTPGDKISVWANWKNDIVTDYGWLTDDNKYVFTNGRKFDVDNQHLMIPSEDPGAVLRVARYFTKFSWTSTTYSRPSPDYTKLVYNENVIGSTELQMVYTRRPDSPVHVKLENKSLSWVTPERHKEIRGYNIYGSTQSGRNFERINKEEILDNKVQVDGTWKYYAVVSIEHSGLESQFSNEVSEDGSRSFYFEAEEMQLEAPARRFFDGYCNNFQSVRINAESENEDNQTGEIKIPLNNLPKGEYNIWGRAKGTGKWSVDTKSFSLNTKEWEWISLGTIDSNKAGEFLAVSSRDDALQLDIVLLTMDEFVPEPYYPADGISPEMLEGLTGSVKDKGVQLSWGKSNAPDLHHYSVYCSSNEEFECNNETIIRSVLKNSITDVPPGNQSNLYYKIVAVDNRWNESEPAVISINR